jgi:hypothetical protein
MKKNLLIHAVFLCLATSCNKSVDNTIEGPPAEGSPGSLSQILFIDPLGDTTTFNYIFDDDNYLIKEWYNNYSTEYTYTRDKEKRVIKITTIGSDVTRTTNVYYNNANEIAYAIDSNELISAIDAVTRDTLKITDSLTFEYANGKVTRINTFLPKAIPSEEPETYKTYEYAGSNIFKISAFYLDDGIYKQQHLAAIKYKYDDKINPFFTPDDIRFLDYGALSANNVIQQNQIYDTNSGPYEDEVFTSEYTYGSNNKPISEKTTGGYPVVYVTQSLYFYK